MGHRIYTEDKVCKNCGSVFSRGAIKIAIWNARIFCSRKCSILSSKQESLLRKIVTSSRTQISVSKTKFAIIDEDQYDILSIYSWRINSHGYVCTTIDDNYVMMHRFVAGLVDGDGKIIDHINLDKLDNRKSNLRVATRALNRVNSVLSSNSTSGYRGVNRSQGRWQARIGITLPDGRYFRKFLGRFDDAETAATAYDRAVAELYGSSINTNFNKVES